MSNSPLVDYVRLSPHYGNRSSKIKKITIHHMAGNLSVETCGAVFCGDRKASSNYGIGSDGRVGLYVNEANRAFTSSNYNNDNQAITIEVANDVIGGDWHISDAALNKLIDLCFDICQRNGIEKLNFTGEASGNVTLHKWFAATACPGKYLESKIPYIVEVVNKRLDLTTPTTNKELVEKAENLVLSFQLAAIADGYTFPKYGADGAWGKECENVARSAIVKQRVNYINRNLTKLVQKIVGVEQDGLCGKDTKAAIKAYQKKKGLKADGIVGFNTWRVMLL